MDPTVQAALIGGGVAVAGSFVTVLGGYVGGKSQRTKVDLRLAAADFLTACDGLWSAECQVAEAVFEMALARGDRDSATRVAADEHRQSGFALRRAATAEANAARSRMVLLTGDLDEPAGDLLAACRVRPQAHVPPPLDEDETAHEEARQLFIKMARRKVN